MRVATGWPDHCAQRSSKPRAIERSAHVSGLGGLSRPFLEIERDVAGRSQVASMTSNRLIAVLCAREHFIPPCPPLLALRFFGSILGEEGALSFALSVSRVCLVPVCGARPKEGFMAHAIEKDDPEHVIAVLNRNRHIKMFMAVMVVLLAFGTLFAATAVMYSADPAARALGTPLR